MKQNLQTTAGAALFGVLLSTALAVQPAAASESGSITMNSVNTGAIQVLSDGESYTEVAGATKKLIAQVDVYLNAHAVGKVKSWAAWLEARPKDGQWVKFDQYGESVSYPFGDRASLIETSTILTIPLNAVSAYAVAICNIMADQKRAQGLDNGQIFSEDRVVPVKFRGGLSWDMSGYNRKPGDAPPEVGGAPIWNGKKVDMICKQSPPALLPKMVEHSNLTIVEQANANALGLCRLNLSSFVQTKLPHQPVRFQYVHAMGEKSGIHTIQTGADRTAHVVHQYELEGSGPRSGQIRIHFIDDKSASDWTPYEVDCKKPGDGGYAVFQPPFGMFNVVTDEEQMIKGKKCPTKLKLIGKIKARTAVSGVASFKGDKHLSLHEYSLGKDESVTVEAFREVDWGFKPVQQFEVAFNIAGNEEGLLTPVPAKTFTIKCTKISLNDDIGKPAGGKALPGANDPEGEVIQKKWKPKFGKKLKKKKLAKWKD